MGQYLVLDVHFVELVDAANPVVRKHQAPAYSSGRGGHN